MLTLPDVSKSYFLKKLIIISLTEIFKDILPGYKIRIWPEKENEQQVSSDVRDVKDYEHTLVKQYKFFIDYLDQSIKDIYKNKSGIIKNHDIVSVTFSV
jgi:nucleolar complex protein 3